MDFAMMIVMFTLGVGIHIALATMALEYIREALPTDPFPFIPFIFGFIVACIGSFLILTSILIVVKIGCGAALV